MPKKKNATRTKNLGAHAIKKKRPLLDSDEEFDAPNKRARTSPSLEPLLGANLDSNIDIPTRQNVDNQSILTVSTDLSELSVDVDVPVHTWVQDLVLWLQKCKVNLGKARVKVLGKMKLPASHITMLGKVPARTKRHHRKLEKEQRERDLNENTHLKLVPTKLSAWFTKKELSIPVPIIVEDDSSEDDDPLEIHDPFRIDEFEEDIPDNPGQSIESRRCTTIEEVEDEDLVTRLSSQDLAEEGLDEPWDPSEETLPSKDPLLDPLPLPNPSFCFTTADETFDPAAASQEYSDPIPSDETFHPAVNAWATKHPEELPSNDDIDKGIQNIQNILTPPWKTGKGFKRPELNFVLQAHLEMMLGFLQLYRAAGYTGWAAQADMMAKAGGHGPWMSQRLKEWSISFCKDPENLLSAEYGKFNSSILEDKDIADDIHLHLQSLGKWVSAADVVRYVATPEFQARLKTKKVISERTAQRWMGKMNYQWQLKPKGMYSDGHECDDIVEYHQKVFLPRWNVFELATRWWKEDGMEDGDAKKWAFIARPDGKIVVIWRHDKSTFYANDQHKLCWVHSSEGAVPYAKGEGASLMAGDFVSPDYHWLRSKKPGPDGKHCSARVLFCAGKN
ncbi:hypothetical protein C8J56DRAFT_1097698 [Mycena floridula]|nr:hypothetical protein C8J56DRAFT_1097698 [Mycena floridula]